MKIRVISLARSHDRRRRMQAQLDGLGMEWSFLDATELREYPPQYDWRRRRRWFGFDLTLGEVGCFLSHRRAWADGLAQGEACWCVLEDDLDILPGFAATLQALEQAAASPPGWDVVRLMQLLPRRGWRQQRLARADGQTLHLLAFHRHPGGAQGYVLTAPAARVLLQHSQTIAEPVDNLLDTYWRHRLDLFCVEPPAIATLPEAPSDIGRRGREHRPRWPGFKRDLAKAWSWPRRWWHNYRRYGRI